MALSTGALALSDFENHRRELTGYCYRMLGSAFDADDAVQETMVRAWKASDSFEGRSSVRTWLYRIATNVCTDLLRGRARRALPMDLGPSCPPVLASLERVLGDEAWISPIADARVADTGVDPAEQVAMRESVRLAFIAALQRLPARQRASLILCEVLRWQAAEVADLLGTSVAAVNSSLQRARATLSALEAEGLSAVPSPAPVEAEQRELLEAYVAAFESYDIERFVSLLHEDAMQSMPPFAMWLRGLSDIGAWMAGPGHECAGSWLVPTSANGCAAFGQYRMNSDGVHRPWALQVVEISGPKIARLHSFLDIERIFPAFGLPTELVTR
jgi:RNA polymerase sigma-70 factor, ECF subfamily